MNSHYDYFFNSLFANKFIYIIGDLCFKKVLIKKLN